MQKTPRLGKASKIAKEYGLPYTTIRDAHFRGDLPVVRIGRAWYIDYRDMDRFIEQSKATRATDWDPSVDRSRS
jgi:hypothetical protein